jgi:hypothetical protein
LSLAPFTHHDANPCAVGRAVKHLDPCRHGRLVIQYHAFAPLAKVFDGRCLVEQDAVLFLDLETWMCKTICEVAIIGEQHQPLAVTV